MKIQKGKKIKRFVAVLLSCIMTATAIPAFELSSFAEETSNAPTVSEKDVLWGDVDKNGKVDADDATALSTAINKSTASTLLWADVNGDGKITNKDVAMITSYADGDIKYFPVGIIYKEGQAYVKKEDWVHNLVTTFKMSVSDKSTIVEYFTDISDSKYKDDINLAANYGIFDIDGDKFEPNTFVTKEFAAYTLNFCLGFKNTSALTCSDKSNVLYQDDVAVALEKGWFSLYDKKFMPDLYALETEITSMLKYSQNVISASTVDPAHKNVIDYNDGVLRLDKSIAVKSDSANGTLTICSDEVSIAKGMSFTCYINGVEIPVKAESVKIDSNGYPVVTVGTVNAGETYKELDVETIAEVDYDNIEWFFDDEPKSKSNSAEMGYIKYLAADKTINFLNKKIDLGDGNSVSVSGSISNITPKIIVKKSADSNSYDQFTLTVSGDANISLNTTGNITSTKSREVKIGNIPAYSTGVATVYIGVYFTISLGGEITVSYNCGVTGGVEYSKANGIRIITDFQKGNFNLESAVTESIAIKFALGAYAGVIDFNAVKLAEVYLQFGEKGTLFAKLQPDGVGCGTLKAYVFAEIGYSIRFINKSNSKEFINYDNSPMKITLHFEDMKLVSKCSYGDDLGSIGSGTGNSGSGSSSGRSWSAYSKYGTEFEGIISTANSSDSKSDGSVTKWIDNVILENDTVVTGDLLLTSYDVIENGNKITKSFGSLDLNGHCLTVYGNLIQTVGTVRINNGTLKIYGDYIIQDIKPSGTISDAAFFMTNQYDKVDISGNFKVYNDVNVQLVFGTLTIGGDIWLEGGIMAYEGAAYSTIHKTILNGSDTQNVNIGTNNTGYDFLELEVTEPENRSIVWNGSFNIEKLLSDINIITDALIINCDLDLNKKNMSIEGNVFEYRSIDFNGGNININGNLNHNEGIIILNNGTLDINGNYLIGRTSVNNAGEIEYLSCLAGIKMIHKNDKVNVSGDFEVHNLDGIGSVDFKEGILTVSGDIWTDIGIMASPYTHRTILNGSGDQYVYIGYTDCFNELEITNPENRYIVWNGQLDLNKLVSDIRIKPDKLKLSKFDLDNNKMIIDGDVTVTHSTGYDSVDLNGGTLIVNGDLLHTSGEIKVNTGKIDVNGNYKMEDSQINNSGEIIYNNCSARLLMVNQYDKVNIMGDLISHSLNSYGCIDLEYGTLSVYGNILSDGGIYTTSDKHKTILASNKKQTVNINETEKFDILVITKSIDNYNFSPNPCWNKLLESILGDLNNDDVANVADIVMLQKYLTNKNKTIINAADLNGDGKVDVFDVILLRRMILKAA